MRFQQIRIVAVAAALALAANAFGQKPTPELQAKIDAKIKKLQSWSTDPMIVGAVQAHNSNPPAAAKGMNNEKWATLTLLDPLVKTLSTNSLAQYLKSKKD